MGTNIQTIKGKMSQSNLEKTIVNDFYCKIWISESIQLERWPCKIIQIIVYVKDKNQPNAKNIKLSWCISFI